MTEEVLELVQALRGPGTDETVLRTLCGSACGALDRRLKDGVRPEDCGGLYPVAAAWLVMDWLGRCQGMDGITALSAGDISVRREEGGDDRKLSERAMELMAPFLEDNGFVFRGVSG